MVSNGRLVKECGNDSRILFGLISCLVFWAAGILLPNKEFLIGPTCILEAVIIHLPEPQRN